MLVVTVGSGAAIAWDAASFFIAAACLVQLPLTVGASASQRPGILADIHEDWTQFRQIPWVWTVTVAFCVVNLVQTGTWQILGPALTQQLSGAQTSGFVLSTRGVGLLLMGAMMYRLVVWHLLPLGLLMGAIGALPLIVLGAHQPHLG
ncbi:MAG: hypothetical protein JO296_16870 [Pseudonocardiales bacterium]|nr:hypothetical protein [Pseudonocardiales bacterium]